MHLRFFSKILFSKCCFFHTYYSLSIKLLKGVPCDRPHRKIPFFWNFEINFKSAKIENLTFYMWCRWPSSAQGHYGVIQRTCLKKRCESKTVGHRPKFMTWRILAVHRWCSVDPVFFKAIAGHPVHFTRETYCCRQIHCQGPWASF